ncbi:hypothetical protein ABZZ20_07325 [Streptomyces sp. NPDC006430]|uniref:hypothetical protein n=1 Tax=Streptomyces sp. NPDC006430 TaxID=3154299 RepID=UPI0033B5BF45
MIDLVVLDADEPGYREFNAPVRADERVESVMLPVADALALARSAEPVPLPGPIPMAGDGARGGWGILR